MTTYDGVLLDQSGALFNVKSSAYGAKADGKYVNDGAMTSGSATLTCSTSHPFTAGDVGKTLQVQGAGPSQAPLITTISGYTSASVVTLGTSASTTVSGKGVTFGTDDTSAITSAISACNAAGGGMVYFPAGTYLISSTLTLPTAERPSVALVGASGAILRARGNFSGAIIKADEPNAFGNRYGRIASLTLEGNSTAPVGLDLGVVVAWSIEAVVIQNCTSVGLKLRGTQHCLFTNVSVIRNGGDGQYDSNALLDLGAATNTFVRCQFGDPQGAYNVLLRRSDDPSYGLILSDNTFVNCNIEGSADSAILVAQIYDRASCHTRFIGCAISAASNATGVVAFLGDVEPGSSGNRHTYFTNCTFSGDASHSYMCTLTGVDPVVFNNCFLEGFKGVFTADDSSGVELIEPLHLGAVGDDGFFIPTETKTAAAVIVGSRVLEVDGTPSNGLEGVPTGISAVYRRSTTVRTNVSGPMRVHGLALT